ncbi:hypothetical protein OQA88_13622 [Cercophora sp. LCS_1]
MDSPPKPKVILFDIGGVCVISPMQAILDYELSNNIPQGWINYAISKSAPNGFWHRLERGAILLDDTFYDGFQTDLTSPSVWATFHSTKGTMPPPPLPKINAPILFNTMMTVATTTDPWMFPALQKLSQSGQFLLAALSNTVIFPPSHPLYTDNGIHPLHALFDVFISSAHVGLRKPDPRVYALALSEADKFARKNVETERGRRLGWAGGITAGDIVFLDDIGENLKAAKKAGFRTIKVPLGRAYEAVEELEGLTGLELDGGHAKVPMGASKAKI